MEAAPIEDRSTPRTAQWNIRVSPTWKDWWTQIQDTIHKATGVDKATLNLLVLDMLGAGVDDLYHQAQLLSPYPDVRRAAAHADEARNASENASA